MIKKADLIDELNEQGHAIQHATLSKWVKVLEEETGRAQGQLLDDAAGELIIDVVNGLRDRLDRGEKVTFREVLRAHVRGHHQPGQSVAAVPTPEPVEPVTLTLSAKDAETLQEILRYTRAHANWQRSVISGLSDARRELTALKAQVQAMNEAEAVPPMFNDEEKDLFFRAALQAELLERGFVVVESVEGVVLMPRTKKGRPLPLPVPSEPEPELSWWRRGLEWVLDRITVRQAS